jgi:hypothetical protein
VDNYGVYHLLEITFFLLFLSSGYGILTIWIKNIQNQN